MAWSTVKGSFNLLSRYAQVMLQDQYAYNQVNSGWQTFAPSVWIQADRDNLARQMAQELKACQRWVGFNLFPSWDVQTIYLDAYRAWNNQTISLNLGYLQGFGVRNTALIQANASVSYNDYTATVSVTTAAITVGRVAMFLRIVDGATGAALESYEIPSDSITYSGGAYVMTSHRGNFVKPSVNSVNYVNGDPKTRNKLDLNDAANFVTAVDVYRVYNDDTLKAELVSLPQDSLTGERVTSVNIVRMNETYSQCILQRLTEFPTYTPYAVRVYAYTGYPLDDESLGRVHAPFEEIISARAKANAPLNVRLSDAPPNTEMYAFADKRANNEADGEGFLPNPIGTRNVDVWTYRKLYPYVIEYGSINDTRWNIGQG